MKEINKFFLLSILCLGMLGAGYFSANAQTASLVASTEGIGTHFELAGSQFLNTTADSSETVKLHLESLPSTILMIIEPQGTALSSQIVLGGFLPLTTYYKYEDDYSNYQAFTADSAGKYAYTQDLSTSHIVFIQTVPSTLYIRDDAAGGNCGTIGDWNWPTKTCTMTRDWDEPIQISNDGITLDGNGHAISAKLAYSYGVIVFGKKNVTVRNMTIRNFSYGIGIFTWANNGKYENNTIENYTYGFYVADARMVQFTGNTLLGNGEDGFYFWNGSWGEVANNTIKGNIYGILLKNTSEQNNIHNNYFKNAVNVRFEDTVFANIWNTARITETNIAGGLIKGGNYWGNNADTGFSDICSDADRDGICNDAYSINSLNTDNSPLSKPDIIAPTTGIFLSGTKISSSWYVTDVLVTLSATDNPYGSGVAKTEYSLDNVNWNNYSGVFAISNENESTVYFRSTDNAGNIEPVKTQIIRIDKTAPVISGASTASANANGWYKANVTVHYSCTDAVSGVNTLTDDKIISTEGQNQSASGICLDFAGNSATAEVLGINIDKTAPTVITSKTPAANSNGWNNTPVEATFTAADSLSGIEGGYQGTVLFNQEGANQSASKSFKDLAGNSASASIEGIKIDMTAPTASGAATTLPNAKGWYGSDVTVAFMASDSLSGLVALPNNIIVSTEGANQEVKQTITDLAGNAFVVTVGKINIDKTAPVISGAPTASANANGWYKANVTIHYSCTDAVSGVNTLTGDEVITAEGQNQSLSGTCSDLAGNSASISVGGINIDKTAPIASGAATTLPNAKGWYGSDVTVAFTANDSLSGLAALPNNIVVSTEGANQEAAQIFTDLAGNFTNVSVGGIRIDKTAPVISGAPTASANANGWYKANVTIHYSCTDAVSGVNTLTGDEVITAEGQNQSTSGICLDFAGNSATAEVSGINIDKTAPTVITSKTPAANSNGWNNTPVEATFTAADSLSGIEGGYQGTVLFNQEGANQSASKSFKDLAGNSASASIEGIKIDMTAPTITVNNPVGGIEYTLGQTISANWLAQDVLSGVSIASGTVQNGGLIDTSTVGVKTFEVNAKDRADNIAAKTINYTVVIPPYNYGGILPPINADGSSIFKLGRTVPVKFQLTGISGNFITDAVAEIYVAKFNDDVLGIEIEPESTSAATTGNLFRYDSTDNLYIFNLDTKTLSAGTWQIRIAMDDGTTKEVNISLR